MKRRDFLLWSGAAAATPLSGLAADPQAPSAGRRDYYELRRYVVETEAQKRGFDAFARDAAIPALNRLGIQPVGVFYPQRELSPVYVLLRHPSLESVATLTGRLAADTEFRRAGASFLDAPASAPAYRRLESSLLIALRGAPTLAQPVQTPGRVFQLRTYESPSVKTGQKKIEMFNSAELAVFRKVGLHRVFFGETLVGAKMPNLTYMLVFHDLDELKANWKKFGASPGWKRLRAMPEYSDKRILCGITNRLLTPAEYSQI